MIRIFRKTWLRTCRFLTEALSWRPNQKQNGLVAWSLVGGFVWLAVDAFRGGIQVEVIGLSACLFAVLAVICAIDAVFGIIPDGANFLLAGGGIAHAALGDKAGLFVGICEAGAVFVVVAAFRGAFRMLRGYDGLGFGDVKFIAAASLWIGYAALPTAILISVASALLAILLFNADRYEIGGRQAIPFGPHLAVGVWLTWAFGQTASFGTV